MIEFAYVGGAVLRVSETDELGLL